MNSVQIDDLKQFIDSRILQSEARSKADISQLRDELKSDIIVLRDELKEDISELRSETREGFKGVAVAFEQLDTQQSRLLKDNQRHEKATTKLRSKPA